MTTSPAPSRLWPEDTVEYHLYSISESSQESLTRLAVECTHHVRLLTLGHIWHYDVFTLSVWAGKEGSIAQTTGQSTSPHLWGMTCYRDNIQDEWLIVYILFTLSKHFPQLVISIADTDGQFLLIEAAHHLPKWLKPESSENRVFVHGGYLHIIPKPSSPAEVTVFPVATPTINEALQLVSNPAIPTIADTSINKCIEERLHCFSSGSLDALLHRTHCYLPCPVAHVISHDPQLLSAAVHALCDRDPSDMIYCRQLKHFSPSTHSCVMTEVKFTRFLYAQLLNERFNTPRNSGFSVAPVGSPRHKACDLGMKLTCGLEILVSRTSGVAGGGGDPVDGDPRWSMFLQSLKEKGYFQDELEGSKLYRQLLASAKDYYVANVQSESSEDSRDPLTVAGGKIAYILQNEAYDEEEMKEKSDHLRPPDDDGWLQVGSDELDAMLHKAAGYLPKDSKEGNSDGGGGGGELDLQSMVFGMKSFVDKVSSHQGAEFPWSVDDSKEVDFNPETFVDALKSMLDGAGATKDRATDDSDVSDDVSLNDSIGSETDHDDDDDDEGVASDGEMEEIMAQMDQELAQTEVGRSFEKMKVSGNDSSQATSGKHVTFEDSKECEETEQNKDDDFQPVDVDFNLVKNLLDSYTSQGGEAGPTSNILHSLGLHIPGHDHDSS